MGSKGAYLVDKIYKNPSILEEPIFWIIAIICIIGIIVYKCSDKK